MDEALRFSGAGIRKRSPCGIDHHPLVHHHVLLQAALEIVAEGGVGIGRRQFAVIGLDQAALADLVVGDPFADGDDAAGHLVARHGRLVSGNIARHRATEPSALRPEVISLLRACSENCLRSFRSEKQRPTHSTLARIW